MMSDTRLAIPDDCNNGVADGEIPIFDMNGCTFRHLTKLVLSSLRVYLKYTQVNILMFCYIVFILLTMTTKVRHASIVHGRRS